ncbi:Uncharacterized protein Fot_09713 [Forsythia ovata]|uniref:Uncharacterized protein n=1 Tax=Forsythia ovata TaxID=205694 RepID=A0ABD1WHB4_9LAMI
MSKNEDDVISSSMDSPTRKWEPLMTGRRNSRPSTPIVGIKENGLGGSRSRSKLDLELKRLECSLNLKTTPGRRKERDPQGSKSCMSELAICVVGFSVGILGRPECPLKFVDNSGAYV